MMYNTIRLLKGEGYQEGMKALEFEKGDTIWSVDSEPKVLTTFIATESDNDEELKANLEILKNSILSMGFCSVYFKSYDIVERKLYTEHAIEYALEYCRCDEEGNFIEGSDYDLIDERGQI